MKTALQAKIEARNIANRIANELALSLAQSFAPLVGKKVLKIGGLMEKYKSLVPSDMPGAFQIYRHPSDYSLDFIVRTCINWGDHFCTYDQACACVGKLTDGVLTEIVTHQPLRTDYTEKEVSEAREALKVAEKALREAQSKLSGFGEYDR
jgi:hypothetical protein